MKRKILVFAPVLALMLSGCFARTPLDPSGTSGTSGKTSGSTSTSSVGPTEDTYGTLDNPITVANALEIAAALDGKLAEDVFADKDAYVKGIVKAAVSEESGKYTFSAADTYGTSSSIKFYEGSVASGVTVPVEGDEVVMFGRIDNYNNGSYLLSGSSDKGIADPDVKKSAHVECTMTTSVVGQGTINNVPAKANTGTKVEFTVTPQSGFKTKSVEVNGVPANEESGKYSFVVVTNTTIVATFVEVERVTGVKLNKNEMTLNLNQDETLIATVEPSTADNKNVSWSIKDNSAAITVDQNGKVHAAQVGTGTVVVTTEDGGKTDECVVTVNPIYVSKVTLNKSSVVLAVGEDDTLTATVEPNDATLQTVTWSVEDVSPEGCVTIDAETGKVTAVDVGTAKVFATANDAHHVKSEACNVEVKSSVVHVSSVALNFENIELEAEDTSSELVATITPANADNKNVTWSLVNVNPAGCVTWSETNHTVTAVSVGSAKVVVTTEDGGKTAECVVTVSPTLVQNVEIKNAPTEPLEVGNEAQLQAVVTPEKATVKDVTWASDHSEYVTVDSTGKIKAVGVGSANISATAKDGSGRFDSVTINVKETKVSSIKLNKTSASLTVGGTETLSVTEILPANATDKTYTWHSGDETIATVSAAGLVTAVKAGEVTIEARANDGSGVHGDCVVTVSDPTPVESALKQAYEEFMANPTEHATTDYTFSGVVTAISGSYFYIQDGEYGMYVYKATLSGTGTLAVGKIVTVTSKLTVYKGLIETAEGGTYTVDGDGVVPTAAVANTLAELEALKLNVLATVPVATLVSKGGEWTDSGSEIYPTVKIGDSGEAIKIKLTKYVYDEASAKVFNDATLGAKLVLNNMITSKFNDTQLLFMNCSSFEQIPVEVESVDIKEDSYTLAPGSSKDMSSEVTILPEGYTSEVTYSVTGNSGVSFDATNKSLLKVAADAPTGDANKATVTVSANGHSDTCFIVVSGEAPATETAKLMLGADNNNAISSSPATVTDDKNNSWTVVSEFAGDAQYNTGDKDCAHIGSGKKMVNKVTLTLEFAKSVKVSSLNVNLKGNSGENGAVKGTIGTTTILESTINSNTVTTLESTSSGSGTTLTLEITPTKKGSVYIYFVEVVYE